MLAIAILTEPRRWPLLLMAAEAGTIVAPALLRVGPPSASILLGLLAGLQAVALATALRTINPRPLALRTLREFSRYLLVAVLGGTIAASILFLAGASRMEGWPAAFPTWRSFTLSALSGYLVVTPTVVLLAEALLPPRRLAPRRWREAGILVLLLVLACGSAFVNHSATWTAFAITLPPLLLWAALRFGAVGASASLLLVTLISTLSPERGPSPFTDRSPGEGAPPLQLFILGIGLPLLGLAVVLDECTRTSVALQSSHARLKDLNHELMAAREEEATRIARELHDDIGQRLALVSIGLGRLRRTCAAGAPGPVADIANLQEQTGAIARTLREISHQLHPAMLDHVGLAAALQLQCEEVNQATGLDVHVADCADTAAVPRDVALCLYRVAQEALNNVVRHSGAHRAELSLRRSGAELELAISDDGRGFVPGAADRRTGLGLFSAAERVRLVGGTLAVDSAPGGGTTLRAAVPFEDAEHA
jgi:two-component system sensor histidine kinase UhpB